MRSTIKCDVKHREYRLNK